MLRGAARLYATSAASRASVAVAAGVDGGAVAAPADPDRRRAVTPGARRGLAARGSSRRSSAFVGRADDPRKNVAPAARRVRAASARELPDGAAPADRRAAGRPLPAPAWRRPAIVPTSRRCCASARCSSSRPSRRASASSSPRRWRAGCRRRHPVGGPEELVRELRRRARSRRARSEHELAEAILGLLADRPGCASCAAAAAPTSRREHAPARFASALADALRGARWADVAVVIGNYEGAARAARLPREPRRRRRTRRPR